MEAVITAVVAMSVALITNGAGYISLVKQSNSSKEVTQVALRRMLKIQLLSEHRRMLQRGFTTYTDLEVWVEVYEQYRDLGGNGVVDKLHEEVVSLPTYPESNR